MKRVKITVEVTNDDGIEIVTHRASWDVDPKKRNKTFDQAETFLKVTLKEE